MKKLLPTLISVFALTVFAQSDKQKSRIPEWFMRPSADSYIGISAPNSSEQDAINMAILPLLMAHDSPAKCKEIIQSVYMESEDNLTSHTSGHYEIMIDTVVSYSIQNISKL